MFGIKEGFDIVIGNPPYIGTGSRNTSTRMSAEEQNYYKTNYPNSAEYKIKLDENYPLYSDVLDFLKTFDWREYLSCIAMRKIQQFHIINIIKEHFKI